MWLYGGAGNDRLKGGAGDDLLVGGTGADRTVGDAWDDIMIAGTSLFDANETTLAGVMAEWTRPDAAFAVRVGHLTSGGLNGGVRLTDATVADDHAEDVLTGSSSDDWFLFNRDGDGGVKDKATDLSAFESQFASDIAWLNQ